MSKKKSFGIIAVIFLIMLVGGLFVYFNDGQQGVITQPNGCTYIENPNNPEYTTTVIGQQSDSFTCLYDKCVVSAGAVVDTPANTGVVVFRGTGPYNIAGKLIAVDSTGDNVMEGYITTTSTSTVCSTAKVLPFNTPEGYKIGTYNSALYILDQCSVSNPAAHKLNPSSNADTSSAPKNNCAGNEVCSQATQYKANLNFCPTLTGSTGPCCSGTLSSKTSNAPFTFKTFDCLSSSDGGEYLMSRNTILTFRPQNTDGTFITNKYLNVRGYDCSCEPAVTAGTACDKSQLQCQQCPSGYTYQTANTYCASVDGAGSVQYQTNICRNGQSACVKPYRSYLNCDGTQQINLATCGDWKTAGNCPTNQYCLAQGTSFTGSTAKYLGACGCMGAQCTFDGQGKPQKKAGATEREYYQCSLVNGCQTWSDLLYCPEGLKYDNTAQDCVCPTVSTCSMGDAKCVLDKIVKCEGTTVAGKTCYQYPTVAATCDGDMVCNNKGTTVADDVCDCSKVEGCTLGDIDCLTTTTYAICQNSNEPFSCLKYRGSTTVPTGQVCQSGVSGQKDKIISDPNYNCAQVPSLCNVANFEVCESGICVCKTDDYTASESDYLGSNNKCINNKIMKVSKVGICYRWEELNTCPTDTFCTLSATLKGSCEYSNKFLNILSNAEYGVNKPIDEVKFVLTDNVPVKSGVAIQYYLLDTTGAPIYASQGSKRTNSNGMTDEFTIEYTISKSGTYKIHAFADAYTVDKEIALKPALDTTLACPTSPVVNADVDCIVTTVDPEKPTIAVSPVYNFEVKQGNTDLSYKLVTINGKDAARFRTSTIGDVAVTVTATKGGYVADSDTTTITVSDLNPTFSTYVDGDMYLGGVVFEAGVHNLKLAMDNAGSVTISKVSATIEEPSTGKVDTLSFRQQPDKSWITSFNMPEKGKSYEVAYTVYFSDVNMESVTASYTFNTVKESALPDWAIPAMIAGAIFIVFIVILVMIRRRK